MPKRLKRVEDNVGPDFVRFVDDGFGVIDIGAAENHMRNRDEQGALVDGVEQALGGNGNAVVRLHHVNLRAVLALRLPEIHDGGKVHVAVDDFVALASEIETGGDYGLAGGDVLMERDGIFGRVHQRADFVADFESERPPAFLPGANAASGPDIGVGVEGVVDGARHGSEGVRDHVVGALEDGELGAVAQKIVAERIVIQKFSGHGGHCNWSIAPAST